VDESFPATILRGTLWDFAEQDLYSSRASFEDAVRQYHDRVLALAPDIPTEERWQPTAVVLRSPRVIIRLISDSGIDDRLWHEVELASDNSESFTGGELLFKLHNAAIGILRYNAHRWFERLDLSGMTSEGVPLYSLRLGS
jgi:hypothetical protein